MSNDALGARESLAIDLDSMTAFSELDIPGDTKSLELYGVSQPIELVCCLNTSIVSSLVRLSLNSVFTDTHAAFWIAEMPSLLHLGWWVDLDEEASLIHGYHRLSEAGDISKPIHTKLESLEVTCVDNSVGDNECLDVDIDTAYEIAEFVVRIPSMKRVSVNSRNGAEQVRSGIGFYKNIGTSRQYTQHCAGLVISETE